MRSLSDIDWASWVPVDVAVLLFVVRGGEVLLIQKKRGLGAGKVNAPGGRIEAGETLEQAALREAREEVGIVAGEPEKRGVLRFQFTDGYGLECHVFMTDRCEGDPVETDEAIPFWCLIDKIPFDAMWADDRLWIPLMLAKRPFSGRFLFDGDVMVDHRIVHD